MREAKIVFGDSHMFSSIEYLHLMLEPTGDA